MEKEFRAAIIKENTSICKWIIKMWIIYRTITRSVDIW